MNCILSLENEKQGDELQRFVNEADQLLSQISDTLADIADTQLDARRVSYSLVLALSNISISSESESPSIIRPF